MFPVVFTFLILSMKRKKKKEKGKKEKKMCNHMNATITKGVTLATHEITSTSQQIPGICNLKFKIGSAEVNPWRPPV